MRLTRRGRIVAGATAITFLWATFFGIQALNALVLSGAVALAGSWLVVHRADPPRVRRRPIEPDVAGEPRAIEIEVAVPPSLTGRVVDSIPDDIRIVDGTADRPITRGRATYTAIADRRGAHRLGPATVEVTDPLGFVVTETEDSSTAVLMTYPEIYPLGGANRSADALLDGAPTRERNEFDHLREYERGDAVRDIDWKSSAKRAAEPLVVKEFVSETAAGTAMIVATSEPGGEDAMASAAASLACHLLDRGISVGVTMADEHILPGSGDPHRRTILSALARTDGGAAERDRREDASVLVEADAAGDVVVTMGSGRRSFDHLAAPEPAATDGGWDG